MSRLRKLRRVSRHLTIGLWRRAAADIAFWFAASDSGSCVIETIQGDQPLGARVCVFAHFDARGILSSHTRRYLDAIVDSGASIVLVSNSTRLQQESLEFASRCCARVLLREKRGYDFGAYRDGILSLGIEPGKFTSLTIANDSVCGPIVPLSAFFDQMDFSKADVWAATDSWQHRYHLQSYLIAFGPTAIEHASFMSFWLAVRNVRSKWAAVRHYEIGLTQLFQAAGLSCTAVWDYQTLIQAARLLVENEAPDPHTQSLAPVIHRSATRAIRAAGARTALNPTSEMWLLLLWLGYPFIKRDLLRHNPSEVPDLDSWHRVVQSKAPGLYHDIIEDLKRSTRRVAP
jgi:hypothetical protein